MKATEFTIRLSPLKSELDEAADFAHGALNHLRESSPHEFPGKLLAPWCLFGSAPLLLHGLRNEVGDVDVFVTGRMWEYLAGRVSWQVKVPSEVDPPLLQKLVAGYTVHVFYVWDNRHPEVNAIECRRSATDVYGWPCASLEVIRGHKAGAYLRNQHSELHQKHLDDVHKIDEYLAGLEREAAMGAGAVVRRYDG